MSERESLFSAHAAPEAIFAELERVYRARQSLDLDISRLEQLYERRVAEKASGQWPAACPDGNTHCDGSDLTHGEWCKEQV